MATEASTVIGGVDTHKPTHYAAASTSMAGCSVIRSSPPPTAATKGCSPGCATR